MSQIRISKFEIVLRTPTPAGRVPSFETMLKFSKFSFGVPTFQAGPQFQMTKTICSFKFNIVWDIGTFVFRICFGFRASDFGFVYAR